MKLIALNEQQLKTVVTCIENDIRNLHCQHIRDRVSLVRDTVVDEAEGDTQNAGLLSILIAQGVDNIEQLQQLPEWDEYDRAERQRLIVAREFGKELLEGETQ